MDATKDAAEFLQTIQTIHTRFQDYVTTQTPTAKDLDAFEQEMHDAVNRTLGRTPKEVPRAEFQEYQNQRGHLYSLCKNLEHDIYFARFPLYKGKPAFNPREGEGIDPPPPQLSPMGTVLKNAMTFDDF